VLQRVFNDVSKPSVKRGAYEYREGDKVMQIGNNYSAGFNEDVKVFNGTIGKIVEIEFAKNKSDADKLHIKFEDIEEVICYEYSELDQIELAYAITCHKSQGSTIKNVLFVFGYDSYKLLSKQFIYTGITRASKGCVMLCELKALRYAIKTDHSGQRNTFLKSLLNEIN
jgi:exodeoxyribonuclease V alpha subunit